MAEMEKQKGKLIVIEGTDGSGKATQSALLAERLKKEGYGVEMIDFPQYGKPSAKLVEDYLNGKLGELDKISPYEAAKFYALDRKEAAPRIREWLSEGKIVIANRYQQSNKGHQAGRIKSNKERKEFMEWIDSLEYTEFGIPRPDRVIFLHVPPHVSEELITGRGNKKDIHESDIQHMRDTERAYMEIARDEGWAVIECAEDDRKADSRIMPKEKIHEMVWEEVVRLLKDSGEN
ncbi:MAG: thymidylate kinase [Candidatus Woesearchaeota archaeon]